jgi:prevent-host-death family protein
MESLQFIPKTDLARKTRQVLKAVQRGQTAIIESHGQPEAAILDIVDYRILRAVMRFHANKIEIDPEAGLSHETIAALKEPQEQYDLVLAYYLGEGISLGHAAELLELPWLDLRARFLRLDVPILAGPDQPAEVLAEINAIKKWEAEDAAPDIS